jgi:acetyl esterase/lipase
MSSLDTSHDHVREPHRPGKPDMVMQKILDTWMDLGPIPIETLSPQEARRQPTPAHAVKKILGSEVGREDPTLGIETQDITIPGPGGPIAARVYSPNLGGSDLKPVVVYWHGGGFVIADLDVYDGGPRGISRFADVVVVSCHYRQAPEHKFPAAHEDALAAYRWVLDNAQTFGGDPRRVAVMGESAGGNLACATAMAARDQGLPLPCHMALIYPVAGNDMETESYRENATAKPLNKAMMKWFVGHTFEEESQTADPRINLVDADLSGLPSATVICAEIDPLRSEGELLAQRLEAAGSEVRHKTFHGSTHEFFGMAPVLPDAVAAQTFVAHELKRAFKTAVLSI